MAPRISGKRSSIITAVMAAALRRSMAPTDRARMAETASRPAVPTTIWSPCPLVSDQTGNTDDAQPDECSLRSAIGSATAAETSPATNVTEPITTAFAASTRPRRGLAANVVRISPRRDSAVMNSAPRVITASRPTSEPLRMSPSGSTPVTYGAMSPDPTTVNVPPDSLKPPVGALGQECPGEGVQYNG